MDSIHGYAVTLTLGSLFNPEAKTGANPFSQCLDITGLQLGALTGFQEIDRVVRNFPAGKFILNLSRGWGGKACFGLAAPPEQGLVVVPCKPEHFGTQIPDAIQRAEDTAVLEAPEFPTVGRLLRGSIGRKRP